MSRNTKEISLIQHRTGKLSEMPKALNQSEIGLASDANRLFIGNSKNTILANRTEFPYQNLEILTEYSNLKDHFRYSYENNITEAINDDTGYTETDRATLKEYYPIVVTCENNLTDTDVAQCTDKIYINSEEIDINSLNTVEDLLAEINSKVNETKTYATIIAPSNGNYITLICTVGQLVVSGDFAIEKMGIPSNIPVDIDLPERKLTEKLDDTLHITDFGIKGDNKNYAKEIYQALLEVYKNFPNEQFYRDVLFTAGTYKFEPSNVDSNITKLYPFPLISNLHVHGEGIDRTIIKSSILDNNYILLNSVDNYANNSNSSNYGNGGGNGYPENILIEDMTFESSNGTVCKIDAAKKIVFNRVKFKSTNNAAILVDITGIDTNSIASDIIFNECIFEGGNIGIFAERLTKNVTITNCKFTNIRTNAIKIADESVASLSVGCKAFNINGNIIENTPNVQSPTTTESYAIKVNYGSTYISIHQTQFDEVLFNNWADTEHNYYPRPYYIAENDDAKNFIDTLDPTTDSKKILGFNFSQPDWRYLDYLMNQDGKVVIVIDGDDEDVTANNGLNIVETQNGMDIRAVGENAGNITLSVENDSDIILGNGTDSESSVSGNIQIKKDLQLNDNIISNEEGTGPIVIKTSEDGIIKVNDNNTGIPYERRIDSDNNAIPNVAYVKNATNLSFEKIITSTDLEDFANTQLKLMTFDNVKYGNNIHLKRITIGARVPFYKTFEDIDKAVLYSNGYRYYVGDVVYGNVNSTTAYAVVLETHTADSNDIEGNDKLKIIPNEPTFDSVKYVSLMAIKNNEMYPLTNTHFEDYYSPAENDTYEMIDIQSNNKFGYNNCTKFTGSYNNTSMSANDRPPMVSYCDRNYVLTQPVIYSSALDLHKINNDGGDDYLNAVRKYDEGYMYTFEFDRNYDFASFDLDGSDNIASINFAGYDLILKFYNYDEELITDLDDYNDKLNPAGKLLVRVEFTREEV